MLVRSFELEKDMVSKQRLLAGRLSGRKNEKVLRERDRKPCDTTRIITCFSSRYIYMYKAPFGLAHSFELPRVSPPTHARTGGTLLMFTSKFFFFYS